MGLFFKLKRKNDLNNKNNVIINNQDKQVITLLSNINYNVGMLKNSVDNLTKQVDKVEQRIDKINYSFIGLKDRVLLIEKEIEIIKNKIK